MPVGYAEDARAAEDTITMGAYCGEEKICLLVLRLNGEFHFSLNVNCG